MLDRIKIMQRVVRVLFLWFALLGSAAAADRPHTTLRLLLSHDAARPGDTITAALEMKSEPKWHTYWRNPGDAGLPTTIDWKLPSGLAAGPIQWPVPHKMVLTQLNSYAYEGTVYLLVPLTIAADAKPGVVQIQAPVTWLECADLCIQQEGIVQAQLTIGTESTRSANFGLIEEARERLPKPAPFAITATWEGPADGEKRPLLIEWAPNGTVKQPDFFPFESEAFIVEAPTEVLQADAEKVRLRKTVERLEENAGWPGLILGLALNDTTPEHPEGYEASLQVGNGPSAPGMAASTGGPGSGGASTSLLAVLGLAFLGGLILNIMPCVLPVIALKILSFVNQAGAEPKRARRLGLIYALGVLASFAALAGLVIAVQRAGGIASWGMQYQNPIFLVVMITLVTLISLNLFGVFEVTLSGKAMGAASELASREGAGGAFFNGVLATVLGTSCTAPFLAFAIGYALGQSALITILIFLMLGVGLAFPYVLLTWNPALLRMLPKPGPWMEKFKVAMGFPMLATAIWLYGVAVNAHFGDRGAFWLAIFLLLVGFGMWVFGAFVQRGTRRKAFAAVISLAALAFGVFFVLEGKLHWRSPVYAREESATPKNSAGVEWQKWSPEAVQQARAAGHPVLVDFTADWCPNCQVNKFTSIEIEPVAKKLKETGAVAMIADFTRPDPLIAEELQRYQRGAVPLVLVYPAEASKPVIVLPPLLTPGIVLEALEKASGNKGNDETSAKALTDGAGTLSARLEAPIDK